MKQALVTGGAGFIGSHLADQLRTEGWHVTVVDNFNAFYDPSQKEQNVAPHLGEADYTLVRSDIRDLSALTKSLSGDYDVIIHLAAMAGVRPSIEDPVVYQDVNVRGTQNLLELARIWGVKQFVFGSSSSVYGVNPSVPWSEDDHGLAPISPYAATKVAGELLGHVYSHLYGIRFVGLRFFTVYGPRQRPDLAINKFARLMLSDRVIPVFGVGDTRRDYTYVGDVVAGIRAAMEYERSTYDIFNIGNDQPVTLMELVEQLAAVLGVTPKLEFLPSQPGDVPQTWADISKSRALLGYAPKTDMKAGLQRFKGWLLDRAQS